MSLITKLKALEDGRPHGRCWVEGDHTTGINGSTEYFFLCAAMDDQDEKGESGRIPGPGRFGRILSSIALGGYGHENRVLTITVFCISSFSNYLKELETLDKKLYKRVCYYLENAQNKNIKEY